MPYRAVSTKNAPAAIGPYAQGVVGCGLLFTSMQIALDPETGDLVGSTAAEQVERCLENVRAIVEAAGSSLGRVVKVSITMTDISEFASVNEVYARFFPKELPARGVVGASALPKGALIAVEAIAEIP